LRELADQPFVLRERGSTTRRAFEAAMQAEGLKVTPVFEIERREGVWKAVERGLGISVVADFEFVLHPNLRALELSDHIIRTQYFIAHHRDRAHSPIIKAFLETVRRMKKRLKAELAAVRARGYSVDDCEHEPELRCVGAPIRNSAGHVFAAISASGPSRRVTPERVADLAPHCRTHQD
jgi:hypothetical protein